MINKSKKLTISLQQRYGLATGNTRRKVYNRDAENAKPGIIYGLDDPVTNELRYIGKTTIDPSIRLTGHLGDIRKLARKDPDARAWHEHLTKIGQPPVMRLIERVETGILDAEIYWIVFHVYHGFNLVNVQHHPHKRGRRLRNAFVFPRGYEIPRVKALHETFGRRSSDWRNTLEKRIAADPYAEIGERISKQIKDAECSQAYDHDLYVRIALMTYKTGEDGIDFKRIKQSLSTIFGASNVEMATIILRSCGIIKQIRTATDKWCDPIDYMQLEWVPLVHVDFHREWMGDIVERYWDKPR